MTRLQFLLMSRCVINERAFNCWLDQFQKRSGYMSQLKAFKLEESYNSSTLARLAKLITDGRMPSLIFIYISNMTSSEPLKSACRSKQIEMMGSYETSRGHLFGWGFDEKKMYFETEVVRSKNPARG